MADEKQGQPGRIPRQPRRAGEGPTAADRARETAAPPGSEAAAHQPPQGWRFPRGPAALLALLVLGIAAVLAGSIVRLTTSTGEIIEWGAVLAIGLSISLGWGIDRIPWLRRREEDPRLSDIRNWQLLKVLAVFLNLLLLLTLIFLISVVLGQAGIVGEIDPSALERVAAALGATMALVIAATYVQAMRNDLELDRSLAVAVAHVVTLLLAFIVASFAVVGEVSETTRGLALLLAWSLTALDLFLTRSVPNVYSLLADRAERYRGASYLSRGKAVFLPIAVAFVLLLAMFLVILAAGPGAERAADAAQARPLVAAVVTVVLVAAVATVVVARRLARAEDRPELYKRSATAEEVRGRLLLWVSVTLGVVGAILAGLVFAGQAGTVEKSWWVDILAAALLLSIGPYGFYVAHESRRIRALEDRFPDFLRDIAGSHRGGLTLSAAVTVAARGDYGALTPYVKRMADQMTWNVAFKTSLEWMAEQVRTPLVQRAVYLILEADRSGGGTADVLFAASRDARELKKMEVDRRIAMSLYTIVIHITFGVFLLVAAVLFSQFVPQIVAAGQATQDATLPGEFGPNTGDTTLADYRAFYYLAALVQAVGGGLVAGLMSTGKTLLGLQHSFIMVALAFVVFTIFLL